MVLLKNLKPPLESLKKWSEISFVHWSLKKILKIHRLLPPMGILNQIKYPQLMGKCWRVY